MIFSSACAFVVILGLIFFDLIPEILTFSNWWAPIFIILGFFLIQSLDLFIPHHSHHHRDNDYEGQDHKKHLQHIGIITIVALTLHNFIEGLGLYNLTLSSVKSGLILCLGIGFHNLPLGIQIGTLNQDKKNVGLIILLVTSAFLGGLITLLFGNIPNFLTEIILALTLGMIIHILIFELLGELVNNRQKKETKYGIMIGIIILIIINLL